MTTFEFIVPQRPVSLQSKRKGLQKWKTFVANEARNNGACLIEKANNIHLTIIYLSDPTPPDVDNIIKPIQDALINVVYRNDDIVCDVDSHRRLMQTLEMNLPQKLTQFVLANPSCDECVYIRVSSELLNLSDI